MTELPHFLTVAELADWLTAQGVPHTESAVRRWCRKGQIDAVLLPGGQWRVTRETAEAILKPRLAASKT